jgi:serine/threonine protein kinase
MGSPTYMAPEQWSTLLAVGPATDIYALGIIAYEALNGCLPKDRRHSAQALATASRHELIRSATQDWEDRARAPGLMLGRGRAREAPRVNERSAGGARRVRVPVSPTAVCSAAGRCNDDGRGSRGSSNNNTP